MSYNTYLIAILTRVGLHLEKTVIIFLLLKMVIAKIRVTLKKNIAMNYYHIIHVCKLLCQHDPYVHQYNGGGLV